jgi:hypothetical protein
MANSATAEAIAVNGRDRRYTQPLDAVEDIRHLPADRLYIGLARELIEFADIGAGDEAGLLAAHEHDAAHLPLFAASSTAPTMRSNSRMAASPSVFMLSPGWSKIAQAMFSKSI